VAWRWRSETDDGVEVTPVDVTQDEIFSTQGDAETWLGENWQELLHGGVRRVTLLDGDREVYGPMSLRPADDGDRAAAP
jgi:hypothetical protein